MLRALVGPGRPRRDPRRRVRRDVPARVEGARARPGSAGARPRSRRPTRCARRGPTRRRSSGSRRRRTRRSAIVDIAAVADVRARARRGRSSSTTRSRRRTSSGRSSSARTSSCTRPRSTSAGTPTSSAGSSRSPTPSSASGSRSCRTRSAAVPSPFDCYLVLRGIKTLGVRMDRHCANARAVAEMLDAHPAVDAGAVSRACRRTRATTSRRGRCAASAGW